MTRKNLQIEFVKRFNCLCISDLKNIIDILVKLNLVENKINILSLKESLHTWQSFVNKYKEQLFSFLEKHKIEEKRVDSILLNKITVKLHDENEIINFQFSDVTKQAQEKKKIIGNSWVTKQAQGKKEYIGSSLVTKEEKENEIIENSITKEDIMNSISDIGRAIYEIFRYIEKNSNVFMDEICKFVSFVTSDLCSLKKLMLFLLELNLLVSDNEGYIKINKLYFFLVNLLTHLTKKVTSSSDLFLPEAVKSIGDLIVPHYIPFCTENVHTYQMLEFSETNNLTRTMYKIHQFLQKNMDFFFNKRTNYCWFVFIIRYITKRLGKYFLFLLDLNVIDNETFILNKEVQKWSNFFQIYNSKINTHHQLVLKDEDLDGFTLENCKPFYFTGFLVVKKCIF